jgi:hypothetical protein
MLGFLKLHTHLSPTHRRVTEVGWVLNSPQATFLWASPRPARRVTRPEHAKNVNLCPAVVDYESRLFEVPCPFDLHLRMRLESNGTARLVDVAGDMSVISPTLLGNMTVIDGPKAWRRPDRPVMQIQTPYTFLADDPVYMTQLGPLLHYSDPPWPGVLISGRVPIHIWPRTLSWAFEWCDLSKDLVLTKGAPWFYVSFETPTMTQGIRLVEAALTPQLSTYMTGIKNVVHYTSRTFSLFGTALERRPARLLTKVQRGRGRQADAFKEASEV